MRRAFHVADLEAENAPAEVRCDGQSARRHHHHRRRDAEVCRVVEKVAPTDVSVLLLGESGTGKELIARAVHARSDRGARRFVAINCAAIPEQLLESELFGFEKGAFTGATRQTLGKIGTPRAAPCFSTRSATCRWPCRPSCCVSCRTA